MGTVGLSFGSPTSGAGFDVSATVSQIVANLENVESPWKTQLTKLDSQDTVLSNLGTLLSNLSTDVGQLTDFTGIMAQKTGSSSDTNVLELTNATSSAVAGTHTVVVKNLATTSSGYLTALPSATATLSGSITLEVGNGTAQKITLNSTDNTLSGLASAINASGLAINASVLTDASGSRLSLVSGTPGANGTISISANNLTAATNAAISYTAATTSSGTLSGVPTAGDTLSGTIKIQVGANAAQTINVDAADNDNTLTSLRDAINGNSSLGVSASIVTNSDGTESLSLSAQGGQALSVTPSLTDTSTPISYTQTVAGKNAALTVDGVNLSSASNTVTNLIPGVTFQLLAPSATESDGSLEQVQVIIGNDNTAVESTVNQMVTDYNSLISAINTQQGNDSSGNAEPLFGSPTLSLLEQQLLGSVNQQNPNGYLTPITVNASTALTGQMTLQAGNGAAETFVMGAGTSSGNTIYTGDNTIEGLVDAINAAVANTPVTYTSATGDSGSLTASTGGNLNGTLSIQTGSGTRQTTYLGALSDAPAGDLATGSSTNTLADLETYISNNSSTLGVTASIVDNGDGSSTLSLSSTDASSLTVTSNVDIPGIGVTAGLTTNNGQSTLSLMSQTAGSAGALTVQSTISATSETALGFTGIGGGGGVNASGVLDPIPSANDILSGSLSIQVGSGTAQTVTIDSSDNTLATLAEAITNTPGIGVTASVVTNADGAVSLALKSLTADSAGNLTVTSNVMDTTNTTTTNLDYTDSSDVSTLANLGITVSQKDDGSLTFDASTLDAALNTDFAGVLGFFQNVNSWGQSFAATLENAGTSSPTGVVALAQKANSSTESTLNAEISKEESLISAEQKSLTAELNSANEIMQELPSQLQGVNELYSAISGYNQSQNG
jgi:flagellar hook-associated protein 2